MTDMATARGLVLDSGVLLLLLAYEHNPESVFSKKSLRGFDVRLNGEDIARLNEIIKQYKTLVVTPHILTEISNLARRADERFRFIFASFVKRQDEQFCESRELVDHQAFFRFGMADAAITDLAVKGYHVITSDGDLARYLKYECGSRCMHIEELVRSS